MTPEIGLLCLALNLYHEARGEPVEGQIAVALTTINRARLAGKSLCDVVATPGQFSWVRHEPQVLDLVAFKRAKSLATAASRLQDYTRGATFYHAAHITPYWAASKKFVGKWGNHVFYKE